MIPVYIYVSRRKVYAVLIETEIEIDIHVIDYMIYCESGRSKVKG